MYEVIEHYLRELESYYKSKNATEHTYRPALQKLLEALLPEDVTVTNEPSRIKGIGSPDLSISKKGVPLFYIEAKDIGKDLASSHYQDQFERYIKGLTRLIITDYLQFIFYDESKEVARIELGFIENGRIVRNEAAFKEFVDHLLTFATSIARTIRSPRRLAELMANRARVFKDVLQATLEDESSTLFMQYEVFKKTLIHDITKKEFSDIYAQTVAFGLFIARYHDKTLEDFSRTEAMRLIPGSHPFLKELFKYISDDDKLDDRLRWIVDSLAEVFLATDLKKLFAAHKDPTIHFYETFLSYYDPATRKRRGVWYTPKEVVDFIVRGVNTLLKREFGLEGLVDERKVEISVEDPDAPRRKSGKRPTKKRLVHKVQILDPATGTGTFLASVVERIKEEFIPSWSDYVTNDLIPRLNGFEILMASYAMAHLKLDMMLSQGTFTPNERIKIFLTNSLEPPHKEYQTLFMQEFTRESQEADRIKKEMPLFVILGNPPYSGHSANKNEWIEELLEEYKKEWDGSRLKEKNPKWLNDDYVKFIRMAQHYIDRTKEGIVAFITAHGYLDNPTFRGMRYSLLKSFDAIYILNLHGNARKKERAPDGSKDENVFDIQQGVAIAFFVKKGSKKLAQVHYADVWGKREVKENFLEENDIDSIEWQRLEPKAPMFYFVPRDSELEAEYNEGFGVTELFRLYSAGVVTARDGFLIDMDKEALIKRIEDFYSFDKEELKRRYGITEKKNFSIDQIRQNTTFDLHKILPIDYRVFDERFIYFEPRMIERGRLEVMRHFLKMENVGLVFHREAKRKEAIANSYFVVDAIIDGHFVDNIAYVAPLYLLSDFGSTPNFNSTTVGKIEEHLGLTFGKDFDEWQLFDYVYAILHHLLYRKRYFDFLKSDFPKIPYPNKERFFTFAEFGKKLRTLHLLRYEAPVVIGWEGEDFVIQNRLNKKDVSIEGEGVSVQLNESTSLFVPKVAWEFFIGGYQPAQKWLKDRRGCKLSRADLKHYNHFVHALLETQRVMDELASLEWR